MESHNKERRPQINLARGEGERENAQCKKSKGTKKGPNRP